MATDCPQNTLRCADHEPDSTRSLQAKLADDSTPARTGTLDKRNRLVIPTAAAGAFTEALLPAAIGGSAEAYSLASKAAVAWDFYEAARATRESNVAELRNAYYVARDKAELHVETTVKGALKGAAAAGVDAGFDTLLQQSFAKDSLANKILQPTLIEAGAMGLAASWPMSLKAKIPLMACAWLEGRLENYFFHS